MKPEKELQEFKALIKDIFRDWIDRYSSEIIKHAKANNLSVSESKKYALDYALRYFDKLNILRKEKIDDELLFKEVILQLFDESVFNYKIDLIHCES